ncbi:putative extracellular exo-polygalacturonase [Aspergillus nomiae NRRL 13137]|uniref:galacturonan 1,4-alpha-galacturonidase n=1 Tax=Aspergillus nomiae NRRL (strain ATCC 15546 / NRRL 13137 / CBS 260.88 / M93) TaxID=1509407 RepID=A0A0L1J6N0_ASPN3|nr:putative extracellular exo-polygalacturonase [Aspergillus nomiae NRRL 13137]KNG87456.1 putative extracellular exo-polygalacturonase [Aspergillus nomiae NRRL 13137]
MKLTQATTLLLSLGLSLPVEGFSLSRTDAVGPKPPFRPLPASSPRNKTCHVHSNGDGTDDAPYILSALKQCNNGGKVVFDEDKEYTIGTALDMTFLKHVDLEILGKITFTPDTDYWQANAFKHTFQNATTFFNLGGTDVNVYGGGELNGNGQVWYDLYAEDALILRPILVGIIGLHGGTIGPLKLRYSPQWYQLVANSSDVLFDGIDVWGYSSSEHEAKNTDGWDTYRSSNIVIQNSVINNGDDCVSFKPNSTEILVQNLHCNGSHGISVGSLGQYPGEVDIVQNVLVYNISMYNASDMARIKVWPGVSSAMSEDLQGGGGLGSVQNITYDHMYIENVDWAIEVTQCYGQKNQTLCNQYPSNLTISDVYFNDLTGVTSAKNDPNVGTIICSSPDVCSGIHATNIDVKSPKGNSDFICTNVDEEFLDVKCASSS